MQRTGFWVVVLIALFALSGSPANIANAKERVLYSFQGGSDGEAPSAAMIVGRDGTLFGTTMLGGGGTCSGGGCGTVFELRPQRDGTWKERVLYSFQGGTDGISPEAPLIADGAGNLFGTTSQGGSGNCDNQNLYGCGTVFELKPSREGGPWTEKVLYNFQGVPSGKGDGDAAQPNGILFGSNGNIYGLAYDGGYCHTDETGTYCYGAAFELKKPDRKFPAWREKVLYRFQGPSGSPAGPAFDTAGNLYGTAPGGAFGCGGVFELSPPLGTGKWTELSVYDFHCGGDGAFPVPGLVFDANGNLYGMSLGSGQGYSNVFELVPGQAGWSEQVLYNFTPPTQGYGPTVGPVLGANGNLYGTTEGGGQNGIGVVFSLASRNGGWKESVLHSFAGSRDGAAPVGGLVRGPSGALYGTTYSGGGGACANGNGCGTVFKVAP